MKEVTQKYNIKKGEIITKQNGGGITVFNSKDKRNVIMLSIKHSNETVDILKRNGENVTRPKVDYNKTKTSVDLSNQTTAYFSTLGKSGKKI